MGITFISDEIFRKVMTSYIVWDHPCWGCFDIDDFCNALSGNASELSSKLLVMAVLAHALRLYVHFNPEVAYNYGIARDETERLWEESKEDKDDSLATAAASCIVFILFDNDGFDKHGREPLMRAQQILLEKRLFDPRLAHQTYNSRSPVSSRSRAALAWGVLHLATITELYVRQSALFLTVPPVPMPSLRAGRDEWLPWPMTRPKVLARTWEIHLAKAGLFAIIRELLELQKMHGAAAIDAEYLDAAELIYARFRDWMSSLDPSLQSCELASQQQIVLHAIYHFAVFELFRPIVTEEPALDSKETEGTAPPAYAIAARAASMKALRQLLVRREALYGGLGLSPLFSSPSLAVIFDALPTASPASSGYTLSAHMAFLTGLRLLMHLSRSMHTVYYAVLSVQQAAARMELSVPIEAEEIFTEAAKALQNSTWQQKTSQGISSNWVVDLSRPTVDDEDARLDSMVAKMNRLNVEDGTREGP